jgi:hypothetical protein
MGPGGGGEDLPPGTPGGKEVRRGLRQVQVPEGSGSPSGGPLRLLQGPSLDLSHRFI